MRPFLAVIVGIVISLVASTLIGMLVGLVFPATVQMRGFSAESAAAAFGQLPLGLKIGIVLSWFGGALLGALSAKRIAGRGWAAWTVAGLFAVYVLLTVLMLPMPGWMQAVAVVAPLIGGLIANHLVGDRAAAGPTMDTPAGNLTD